ncbi:MAG: hypothetical protein ABEI53_02870 [Candidatus Magasanikbacteria bacterium]
MNYSRKEKELVELWKKHRNRIKEYKGGKNLMERPAKGRNFNVSPILLERKGNNFKDIILRKDDSKILRLSNYLPEGVCFVEDKTFMYDTRSGSIFFDGGKTKLASFLPLIFYNIGHSKQKGEDHDHFNEISLKARFSIPRNLEECIESINNKRMNADSKAYFLDKFAFNSSTISREDWLSFAKLHRNAWSYSLRKVRALRRQGWNVFAGFSIEKDFMKMIYNCLESKELWVNSVVELSCKAQNKEVQLPGEIFTR